MTLRDVVAGLGIIGVALPLAAQDVRSRIDAVRDGSVRVAFPTREGVCGWGRHARFAAPDVRADWEPDCEGAPARVVVTRAGGVTVDIDTYIGGRWRPRTGVTDLGTVSAAAAADVFLTMAERLTADVAEDAVYPAAVADAEVTPRLLGIARNRQRPGDVREQAVFWVGQIGADDAADALRALLVDPDADLREKVVFALAQMTGSRGGAVLRDLVLDQTAARAIREKAIFWLGQTPDGDNQAFLRDAFGRVGDDGLRERIIFSMSQRQSDADATWLVNEVVMARLVPHPLREKAIFWLGQMARQGERLVGLYDRVDSDVLRERLIFAYAQRRDDATVDKLIDIARNDDEAGLRRHAIFWLGQSRHPKAVEALAALIGS